MPNHAGNDWSLPAAASYLVLAFKDLAQAHGGPAAVLSAVTGLQVGAPDGATIDVVTLPDTTSGSLEIVNTLVSQAYVGLVIALVGSERHVYAARSVALGAGADPSEITTMCLDVEPDADDTVRWSDSSQPRNLFCAHCHELFTADAAVGDAVTCPSCGLLLAVHYNFSRRRGAYMATQVSTVGLANRGSQP